jgi:predicted MFS family arabinose efflux permease
VVYSLARVLPFGADAASFLGSSALLLGLGREPEPTGPRPGRRGLSRQLVADVRAGLSWYRRSRVLGLLSATVATLALTQAMVSAILVLFALEALHLSTTGYGVFMGVFAVGNVLGGVLANRALRVLGTARVVALAALLSGLGYLATGTLSSPVAAAGVLAVVALAVVCGNVATVSFRQATVPPALQARVATVWRAVVWAALPLGSLLGGVLAAGLGLRIPFFVAGGAQALLAVIVAGPLARLIKAASAAPEPAAGTTRPGQR